MIAIHTIIFTDKDGNSTRYAPNREGRIPWINGVPAKIILWNNKLWRFEGMGLSAYFYHEEESFIFLDNNSR